MFPTKSDKSSPSKPSNLPPSKGRSAKAKPVTHPALNGLKAAIPTKGSANLDKGKSPVHNGPPPPSGTANSVQNQALLMKLKQRQNEDPTKGLRNSLKLKDTGNLATQVAALTGNN